MYTNLTKDLLDGYGVEPGDSIRITVVFPEQPHLAGDQTLTFDCILLDRGSRSREENIIVKVPSGYNLSLNRSWIREILLLDRSVEAHEVSERKSVEESDKRVVLIGTGGTIASMVDYRTGGVHPAMSPEDLHEANPELSGICELDLVVASSVLSEDMTTEYWDAYTEKVKEAFESGAAGVVLAHGTDTLASTSAALSFTLDSPPGPVVLVGSQRSSDRPSSDSRQNLKHSLLLASSNIAGGVYVVMHATVNDGPSLIHLGSRVRKMHSSRRDAFVSINSLPVGSIVDDEIRIPVSPGKRFGAFNVRTGFDKRVLLLNSQVSELDPVLDTVKESYRALVIAGTGLGHINSRYKEKIKEMVNMGIQVIMTTDCISGWTDLDVYSTGRDLKDAGVISAGDMIPHVALIKAMWVLDKLTGTAPEDFNSEFKRLFLTEVAGEIGERRVLGSFGPEYLKTLRDLGVD